MPNFKAEDVKNMFFFNDDMKKSNAGFFKALGLKGENGDILTKCGLHGSREDSMGAVFRFFLMSRDNPAMDFKQAYQMKPPKEGFDQALADFMTFAKNHQIQGEGIDPQKRKENIKAWTQMFKKATDKMKQYKLPDIDYGNPVQVYAHREELAALTSCFINFSQEFRDSFYNGLGKDAAVVDETLGGKAAYEDLMSTWENIGFIAQPLQAAYMPNNLEEYIKKNDVQLREVSFQTACTQRYCLSRISDQIRGKQFSTFSDECAPKDLYQANISFNIRKGINLDNTKQQDNPLRHAYLKNQDHKLDTVFQKQYDAQKKKQRLEFNANRKYEAKSKFLSNLESGLKRGFGAKFDKLFEGDPEPQELARRVEAKEFSETVFQMESFYDGGFASDNQDRIYKILNERPVNNFLIEGKSPKELWGEKYAFLKDQGKIEKMYRIELMREIVKGDKDIQATTWYQDENNLCHRTEPFNVVKSKETREREVAVIAEMYKLNKELCDIRQTLLETQKDKAANLPGVDGKTGSELYRKMFSALNKCIDASLFTNMNKNMNDLQKALKDYHKASAEYYKKRKGILFTPRGNGKTRLDISKNIADTLLDKAERLKLLSGGLDLTPSAYEAPNTNYSNHILMSRHGEYELEKRLPQRGGNVKYYSFDREMNDYVLTEAAEQAHQQAVAGIVQKQAKKKQLRQSLKETLSHMVFREEKLAVLDDMVYETDKKPVSICAKNVISEKYLEKIDDPQISMEELTKLEKKIEPEKIQKEVVELVKSPIFRQVVAKCPKTYEKKWDKIEKNAEGVRKDYEKDLETLSEQLQKSAETYGQGGMEEKQPQPMSSDKAEELEMKIAHMMTLQVLTKVHNPDIMRAVAISGDNFTAVFDTSLKYVKEKGLAKPENLSQTVNQDLKDDKLMGHIVDRLAAKNPENPKAKQKPIIRELVQPHREIRKELRAPGLV